jgi:hypothetical protein
VGITFNHDDWDGLADQIDYLGPQVVEKALARVLADRAQAMGLSSADTLQLPVDFDIDRFNNPDIDPDRVRTMANDLLAQQGSG